jgi:hypothetical protein
MEVPITKREFENWETMGASVLMKNKIVVVPELADRRGAILAKNPVPVKEKWILDMAITIGKEENSQRGGNGVGIYYLKGVNKDEVAKG